MSKLEELRAENERLKSELEIARQNRLTAEALVETARSLKPLTGQEQAAEFAKREAEVAARLKGEHEAARAKLADGPRKFWVHLAHQLPVGTSLDHPELLVGAADEHEARKKYLRALGVIKTPHEPAVIDAIDGQPCDAAALVAMAESLYVPQG